MNTSTSNTMSGPGADLTAALAQKAPAMPRIIKVGNMTVDAGKIGAGLYGLIQDKGEEAIVAFGMIPSWVVESLEQQLRRLIVERQAHHLQMATEDLQPYVDEASIAEFIRPIVHECIIGIYDAAKAAGLLAV